MASMRYDTVHDISREVEKGTNFLLCAYLTETGEFFFTYIEESISYNSVFRLLAVCWPGAQSA